MGSCTFRSGKQRQGDINEQKMSNYVWNLLDGTLDARYRYASHADHPVVEDLKDLVLNYCGYIRTPGRLVPGRALYFLDLTKVSHCLSQVRDELIPLRDPYDDWE